MAQPTNTFDSYDAVGIREDLSDIIHNVTPYETPFFSSAGKTKASNTYHEWQTDALRSSADNKHIEGDDTVAEARTATTRLGNYTQIFKNSVVIPDTDMGLDKAGRAAEMAYQIVKVTREHRLDIEKAMLASNARVAGNSTTARELAGVPAWLYTNTVNETGNTGADPTGDGTDTRTDDGTPTALTQARFDTAMQSIWDNSGGKGGNYTCLLSSFQMAIVNNFVGNNNQRAQIDAGKKMVIDVVDVYMTSWGTIDFVKSREIRSRDVLILDMDYFKVATLRPTKNVELAKTGDATKRQIVTELTLESCNEAASGGVFDNTTS